MKMERRLLLGSCRAAATSKEAEVAGIFERDSTRRTVASMYRYAFECMMIPLRELK